MVKCVRCTCMCVYVCIITAKWIIHARIEDCITTWIVGCNPIDYHHNITYFDAMYNLYILRNQRSLSFRCDSVIQNWALLFAFRLLVLFVLRKVARKLKGTANEQMNCLTGGLLRQATTHDPCTSIFCIPSKTKFKSGLIQKSMPIKLNQIMIIECTKFNWQILMVRPRIQSALGMCGFVIVNRKGKKISNNNND